MTSYGSENLTKIKAEREKLPPLRLLSSFCDPRQPWVLVPNGSLYGFFDWVPERLRVGPWKPIAPIILIILSTLIILTRPPKFFHDSPTTLLSSYPELYSLYWWYNLSACIFMATLISYIMYIRTPGVAVTYTILSWILNSIRHGILALAPFLSDHHTILQINRMARFPALTTAAVTTTVWNLVLLPYIYVIIMDTTEKKYRFTEWNMQFRMIQLHVCNIIYAILNTLVTCRSQSMVLNHEVQLFEKDDLWYGLAYGLAYGLFYNLVLDRLGIHVYPIFSPRSNLCFVTWSGVLVIYLSQYYVWNEIIQNSSLVESVTLYKIMGVTVSVTVVGVIVSSLLSRSQSRYVSSSDDEDSQKKS
jgi:hypothetical protein